MRSSLDKEVANVLWDYGKEVTNSLSGLTRILKMRFGGKSFADKHRIEIRNKQRAPNETLQSLHIEIRRLVAALAFPTMEHRTREVISCDYFLDALGTQTLRLKICDRHPEDLDSALRIALQLEVWTKDSLRLHEATSREQNKEVKLHNGELKSEPKKMREVTKPKSNSDNNDELKKEVEEQRKKIAELESKLSKVPTPKPLLGMQFPNKARTNTSQLACYNCGKNGHIVRDCHAKRSQNPNGFAPGFAPKGPSPAGYVANGLVSNGQFVPGLVQNAQFPPYFMPNGQGAYGFGPAGQYPLGYGPTLPNGQIQNGQTSSQISPPESANNVRPIREKQVKTCIEVVYEGETISALVDTGSDVSIAGDDVARRFGWKVHEHPTKTVKMANDAKIPLRVGGRRVKSEILITPDLNGLIIGIDWLEKQGEFV